MVSRIIDISVPLFSGMVFYPGDTKPSIEPGKQISDGDNANLSEIRIGTHTGTHVDAPHHFIDGQETIDKLPLDVLLGPARVVDLTRVQESINRADLEQAGTEGAERILFKTSNSKLLESVAFNGEYVSLSDDGADYLIENGVKLVGNDYLSIEGFKTETHYVHKRLLQAGTIILEGIDLADVEPGEYELACLPLKILGGDGAPARAVLIERLE